MESQGPTFGAHFLEFLWKKFYLVKTNLFGTRKLRALPRTVYLVSSGGGTEWPPAPQALPRFSKVLLYRSFVHISIRRSLRSRTFRLSQTFKIQISTKCQNDWVSNREISETDIQTIFCSPKFNGSMRQLRHDWSRCAVRSVQSSIILGNLRCSERFQGEIDWHRS